MRFSKPYLAGSFVEEHEGHSDPEGALAEPEPDTLAKTVYSLPKGSDAKTAKNFPLHSTWHAHPDWRKQAYGGVIVRPDGKVLLREPMNHFDGYAWTWPKGKMDNENEHPADTAIREVREETGFKTKIFDAIPGTFTSGTGSRANFYLMCTDGEPERMDWETWKLQWAGCDEANQEVLKRKPPQRSLYYRSLYLLSRYEPADE